MFSAASAVLADVAVGFSESTVGASQDLQSVQWLLGFLNWATSFFGFVESQRLRIRQCCTAPGWTITNSNRPGNFPSFCTSMPFVGVVCFTLPLQNSNFQTSIFCNQLQASHCSATFRLSAFLSVSLSLSPSVSLRLSLSLPLLLARSLSLSIELSLSFFCLFCFTLHHLLFPCPIAVSLTSLRSYSWAHVIPM